MPEPLNEIWSSACEEQHIQLNYNDRFILADYQTVQMPLVIRQASLRPRNWLSRSARDTRSTTTTPEEAAGERCRRIHTYLRACDRLARTRESRRGRITWTSGRRDHPCPRLRKSLPRCLVYSYLLSRKLNSSRRSRTEGAASSLKTEEKELRVKGVNEEKNAKYF